MGSLTPLELLYEKPGLPAFGLPAALAAAYGGDLGIEAPRVYANFVTSLDGIVALGGEVESGSIISGHSEADRFVMGLLRACADAVVVGAGTFRKTPGHLWTAERVAPAMAPAFAELRSKLGLSTRPLFVLLTASGEVDVTHPALAGDALVVTTASGRTRLAGKLAPTVRVAAFEGTRLALAPVLAMLRAQGLRRILSEGGPTLIGDLIAEGALDELFLTRSPLLLGRKDGDGRKTLVEGVDLARKRPSLELLSLRRHDSFLFLRYSLGARRQ
jgi:riboflavin biosynthesis pyrimidine reductase